ncbi:MAG: hypothetical protein PUA69_00630 [Erysipelotrichaceae bacterium]|nr:hypothetical protein [Erysipelotrichaceae bacterium]
MTVKKMRHISSLLLLVYLIIKVITLCMPDLSIHLAWLTHLLFFITALCIAYYLYLYQRWMKKKALRKKRNA